VIRVRAPGRVNLIGDHTDYTGGLVMPMTIDRWTVIEAEPGEGPIELTSDTENAGVTLALPIADPSTTEPPWGRFVAGVAAELGPEAQSIRGRVTTSIPIGAGLSSSAALEIAAALALGFRGSSTELAQLCRRAEHRATGVPCGIMDQLCIAAGVAEHALLIDCYTLAIDPVRVPADLVVIVHFVQHRQLDGSEYATRVAECAAVEALIGPLRLATADLLDRIGDPILRRRARHVITENQRVRDFAKALRAGAYVAAGHLMLRSHASLRDDFETSTPAMDEAVAAMAAIPGVYGARMTGGGFGGCIVAIAEVGTPTPGWQIRAVAGATRTTVTPTTLTPATDTPALSRDGADHDN
jgi:galactokinase